MRRQEFSKQLWAMGFRRYGRNADWPNFEVWHLDQGIANDRGGDAYLVDYGVGGCAIVQRFYAVNDYAPLSAEEVEELGADGSKDIVERIFDLRADAKGLALVTRIRNAVAEGPMAMRALGFLRADEERARDVANVAWAQARGRARASEYRAAMAKPGADPEAEQDA